MHVNVNVQTFPRVALLPYFFRIALDQQIVHVYVGLNAIIPARI